MRAAVTPSTPISRLRGPERPAGRPARSAGARHVRGPIRSGFDDPCRAQDPAAFVGRIGVLPGERLVRPGTLQEGQCGPGITQHSERAGAVAQDRVQVQVACRPRRMSASSPARMPPWSETAV